ncbi:MAG: response regulator [Candidatus Omnitrophota bacterium]
MARILVIDDNDEFRDIIRRWLEDGGYEVVEAVNGEEGIKRYREKPADIVIADIIMPKKEGIETMMELKRDFPDVKIIAVSGGGVVDPRDYLEGAKLIGGATRTFAKPFKREELLKAITELLAG